MTEEEILTHKQTKPIHKPIREVEKKTVRNKGKAFNYYLMKCEEFERKRINQIRKDELITVFDLLEQEAEKILDPKVLLFISEFSKILDKEFEKYE